MAISDQEALHEHGLGNSGSLNTLEHSAVALGVASVVSSVTCLAVERPALRLG